MADASNELIQKAYGAIEIAKKSGKIKKGSNEVTKAIERGTAKLVAIAEDATPKEIVMHIPILCKERKVPCIHVPSKQELGACVGIEVATVAVAIVDEGDAKKSVSEIAHHISNL